MAKQANECMAFARHLVYDNDSATAAYRKVFDCSEMTDKQVSDAAHRLSKSARVKNLLKDFKKQFEDEDIITRTELLYKVKKLIEEAEKDTYVVNFHGESMPGFNPRSAKVLIMAIERAAKLIGADEPEKVDNTVTVVFEGGDYDEYAH